MNRIGLIRGAIVDLTVKDNVCNPKVLAVVAADGAEALQAAQELVDDFNRYAASHYGPQEKR